MKILSSVRDLVLNYAYNVAKNKGENKLEFQEQVLSGLKNLRDRYPELLFVNYDNSISDEESKDVFLSIKSKVKDRYRISYIPSSLSFVEVIGGQRVEIPGLINLEDGGYLCIRYDTHDNKKKLLNQVLLHLLMQLPIKKILFSFVDLSGNYDEDFFIKNVDPSIYHGRPITSDNQLEELLEELEKRRFEVTRNYGDFSKYCQEHCTIPIPNEFIVLLDENYDNRFRQRLNNIIKSGHKYGVYLIIFQNTGELRYPDNCILNPNGNELYISPLFNSTNEESFDFSGDFYYFPDNQIDCIPHSSSSHRETISTNFVARGFGDYEVVLSVNEDSNTQDLYSVCIKIGIPKNRIDEIVNTRADIVLASFPTKEEANDYIDKLCAQYKIPESVTCFDNNIYLEPCWRDKGLLSTYIFMGLWIPQSTCDNVSALLDDFKFYMKELGVTGDLFKRMINCIGDGFQLSTAQRFVENAANREKSGNAFDLFQDVLVGHMQKKGDYYLYYFGKENEVYIDDALVDLLPFSGVAISYWDDPKFDNERECKDYIFNVEKHLHECAIKKWGRQYYRSHLFVGRTPPGVMSQMEKDSYHIRVRKIPHVKKAIWKYEVPKPSGLINYTSITENKHLLDACLNYINSEANDDKNLFDKSRIGNSNINDLGNGGDNFDVTSKFYLDEVVKEQLMAVKSKSPVAFMGKTVDIRQKDLYIKLNEDYSENVLLVGQNDQEQVTRTTMNLFVSLMMSAKLKHKDIAFKVIDCLNNEEGEMHDLVLDLENAGYCEIVERRQRSKFFKELAQGILDGTAKETILLILGQDRFRELKMDMELDECNNNEPSKQTYRKTLNVILDKGPDFGVHTLLQIEKLSNLLFENNITPKFVFQKFKHLVMLKSNENYVVTLHLNDDIHLEKLSSDWERLCAYYYAEESDSLTLFTPYIPLKSKDVVKMLNEICL